MTRLNSKSKILMALKPSKRRAVAEVISSLLLVAITVVGALLLTSFLDETFVAGSSSITGTTTSGLTLDLIAYDTRDSTELLNMTSADNKFDFATNKLLGVGAPSVDSHFIPADDGSEFLVIQVENRKINPIFIQSISINGKAHVWDLLTSERNFDASTTSASTGDYPEDGKFSISEISSPWKQSATSEIKEGQTVNLIVKLGSLDTDIDLNKSIRVLLNIGAAQPIEFVIDSGTAK